MHRLETRVWESASRSCMCFAVSHLTLCLAQHALSCLSHLIALCTCIFLLLRSSSSSSSIESRSCGLSPFPLHFSAIAIYQDVISVITGAASLLSLLRILRRLASSSRISGTSTPLPVVILMTLCSLLLSPRRLQLLPSPHLIPSTVSVSRIISARPLSFCGCSHSERLAVSLFFGEPVIFFSSRMYRMHEQSVSFVAIVPVTLPGRSSHAQRDLSPFAAVVSPCRSARALVNVLTANALSSHLVRLRSSHHGRSSPSSSRHSWT